MLAFSFFVLITSLRRDTGCGCRAGCICYACLLSSLLLDTVLLLSEVDLTLAVRKMLTEEYFKANVNFLSGHVLC